MLQNLSSAAVMIGALRVTLANSTDPGEMQRSMAFHLVLHRLTKYPFMGFPYTKVEHYHQYFQLIKQYFYN